MNAGVFHIADRTISLRPEKEQEPPGRVKSVQEIFDHPVRW
jgi:hypothetical protein